MEKVFGLCKTFAQKVVNFAVVIKQWTLNFNFVRYDTVRYSF